MRVVPERYRARAASHDASTRMVPPMPHGRVAEAGVAAFEESRSEEATFGAKSLVVRERRGASRRLAPRRRARAHPALDGPPRVCESLV